MERRGKIVYYSFVAIVGLTIFLLLYYNGYDDINYHLFIWLVFFLLSWFAYRILNGNSINLLAPVRYMGKGLSKTASKLGNSSLNWLKKQKISDYKIKAKLPKYDYEKKEDISPGVEIRKNIDPPKKLGPMKVKEAFIGADSSEVYGGVRTEVGNIEADVKVSTKDIMKIDDVKIKKKEIN